ncbi:MAG: hypothetical protein A3G47_03420 [Candidatus Zambryskibacteria bacterium RIFCSPLOWO2_12_FULL_39_45]|uniref:DUF378 domain-containing protein n=3 Tax=Candidatus Zambryskiibacteriota TaxID=1817925 RepID=A0A1G2T9C1_9BACT|nr:MAG: hypothetical protein UT81_C0010G0022 [Parcubacteria group bacterium GW2011_GWA2_40_14]OHA93885.1 MAG: hypothetical protein A2W58_00380 [Candidatus Zambryskibacteria bacterium RIFCSPHIGHO2_02_38_10.5]OHA97302.1 MAG: hypothetical protein A3C63_01115 [Candidatus Zambryskibacteria bacterium RIFCSPHIGHO2_02_FULL_39_82]OHA97522.1 MAG: hypothetical protein A3E32_00895 [Candidatus Zambryskibacteria bacterium RIFCSPHIGHO2_12_FULL_38_37]OHB07491.1 MAG: hypothetical protein A2W64_03870 [Candidatus
MKLHKITFILLIIGGLNWGLEALGYNLVDWVFGMDSTIAMVVYLLVGLSAVYEIVSHKGLCRNCSQGQM